MISRNICKIIIREKFHRFDSFCLDWKYECLIMVFWFFFCKTSWYQNEHLASIRIQLSLDDFYLQQVYCKKLQSSSRKSSQAGFSTEKKSAKDIIYFNFTILSYQSCPKDDNLILETILKIAEATVTYFFSLSRVAIPSSSSNMLLFWK